MKTVSAMSLKLADAEKLYAENTNLKREDVQAILQWLQKQPHLPEIPEIQVIPFLQSCDYRIEAAKPVIDNYFSIRTHNPDIFDSANEEIIRAVLAVESISILPRKTPEGYIIFHCKLLDFRPEKFIFLNHIKVGVMVMGLYIHQQGPANGIVFLFDTKGATIGHLARINLAAVKTMIHFIQEAAPIKVRGIHYVNVVPVTEKAVNLIKSFMKKEIANLINLHSTFESIHKVIPKECLPEGYGGHLPPIEQLLDENIKKLVDNSHFFKWHDSQKVDESKRTGKSTKTNNAFGMDGTFKKLELD